METIMFEKEENGRSQDGWYKHKETGAVVELTNDPGFGTPLTNAYIRAGFEFVGTTDPREAEKAKIEAEATKAKAAKEAEDKAEAERKAAEETERKRIAEIEAENAKLKAEATKAKEDVKVSKNS